MILTLLILILLIGGAAAWAAERKSPLWSRGIALGAVTLDLLLVVGQWAALRHAPEFLKPGAWLVETRAEWIPQFGVSFHLGMDGLSLLLLALTFFLGALSVACSWSEIQKRVGFFHFNLLWVLAGIAGVFTALDLFLFYFFWEMMLIPMYLLIVIWGHERRVYSAIKFFLFTQASGLLMLIAILTLQFLHFKQTGARSFDYSDLLNVAMTPRAAMLLMLVPEASLRFAPVAMALGVVGILYGAILAFAQTDLKRLVAYTSVSHLGFVVLGIYSWNAWAMQGAVMQMICHGLSTGALFVLVGLLYERIHTRDLRRMGGLWSAAPRIGAMAMFFAMASLGLPGLGNFIAEFLVLLGAYHVSVWMTALAGIGLVGATIYSLSLMQRAFHGPAEEAWSFADLSAREWAVLGAMAAALVWLGLYPQPVLHAAAPIVESLEKIGSALPGFFMR
ncbi:MAG: NADH-quinone oxidoreductase subunit M [Candidatus Sumerlaeota bacterium]|nr:NADH-quinone oxidoreductase subunit M [Candidatus Sumerlaeota bacterium]